MINEEAELAVLKSASKATTQKSLADEIGYSVGKVNYVLKGLMEKGFIKAERFMSSNNKLQYRYLLTEQGIKEKIDITERFIKRKKQEYDTLQAEMQQYKEQYDYAKSKI